MFKNIATKFSENKGKIARKALIVGGSLLGLVAVGAIYKLGTQSDGIPELPEALSE